MAVAVDSSALWSIFNAEYQAQAWVQLFTELRQTTSLVVCEIVWAEIAPYFDSINALEANMSALGIAFDPVLPHTAFEAGKIFKTYRQQGGPRSQLVADFLVGAHAFHQAEALLSADRGYHRRFFKDLKIINP